jgi:multiple sugar transport system substrate-binding protein
VQTIFIPSIVSQLGLAFDRSTLESDGETVSAKSATYLFAMLLVVVTLFIASERIAIRPNAKSRVTVLYWEKWTGSEADEMRKTVDAFNRSQDKISVKYLSISDVANKTLLATAGGDPPDVAGLWGDDVTQFADANALTDLTELARKNGIVQADYIPAYWGVLNYRGKLWALPSTPSSTAMHVNAELAPQGFNTPATFPHTFEALDRLSDRVTKIGKGGQLELAGFLPSEPGWWNWAWGYWFGGNLMQGNRLTINDPLNVKAFEWIAHISKKIGVGPMQNFQSGFGNFASPEDAFMAGKVVSELHGVYKANYIRLYKPDMKWFALPFVHPEDRPDLADRSALGTDLLVIPSGAKHPKEAFAFLKYLQRQDVMESLCMRHGKNSPLAKVSKYFLNHHPNPYIALFDRLARSKGAFFPPQVGILPQIEDEMGNVFQEVNLGEKTPQQALDEAQARLNSQWLTYQRQVLGQP